MLYPYAGYMLAAMLIMVFPYWALFDGYKLAKRGATAYMEWVNEYNSKS